MICRSVFSRSWAASVVTVRPSACVITQRKYASWSSAFEGTRSFALSADGYALLSRTFQDAPSSVLISQA